MALKMQESPHVVTLCQNFLNFHFVKLQNVHVDLQMNARLFQQNLLQGAVMPLETFGENSNFMSSLNYSVIAGVNILPAPRAPQGKIDCCIPSGRELSGLVWLRRTERKKLQSSKFSPHNNRKMFLFEMLQLNVVIFLVARSPLCPDGSQNFSFAYIFCTQDHFAASYWSYTMPDTCRPTCSVVPSFVWAGCLKL